MIRYLLSFSLFIILSGASLAQVPVQIRSGEHGTFTRLTVQLSAGMEWRIDKQDSELTIALSLPLPSIDITSVFRRIGRTRVSDVIPRDDMRGLQIILGCNCGFRAYLEDGSLLVIDIGENLPKNLTAGSQDSIPNILDETETKNKIQIPIIPERNWHSPGLNIILTNNLRPSDASRPSKMNTDSETKESEIEHSEHPEHPEHQNKSSKTSQLYDTIVEAQRQGILLAPQRTPADENITEAQSLAVTFPNITTRMATETDSDPQSEVEPTDTVDACLPRKWFDISDWEHPNGFSLGVGDWSARMMKEFDIIDTEALLALTRHYLHYGFGAEASATLKLFSVVSAEIEVLSSLARIIENGFDPEIKEMFDIMNCEGPEALWAILSLQDLTTGKIRNSNDLQMQFADLPVHLQKHLGPILTSRLTKAGEAELAESILSRLTRNLEKPPSELELAQAKLALVGENPDEAIGHLESAVEQNTAASPEALIALIDTYVAKGEPIDQAKVDLAASYMFENRRTPLAKDISRSYILALAYSDQFEKAFAQIFKGENDDPDPTLMSTISTIMSRLVSHASDREFLLRVLNAPPFSLPSEVENNIAGRLLSLGFAEAANGFLNSPADKSEQRARRILRAEVALALFQPMDAEAELLGLVGEDADRLRVQARELAGDYAGALRGVDPQVLSEQRRDLAWLAGDWSTLAEGDQDLLAQTAQLAITHDNDSAENEIDTQASGFLRQARDLITNSQESRSVLEALLAEFEIDTVEGP